MRRLVGLSGVDEAWALVERRALGARIMLGASLIPAAVALAFSPEGVPPFNAMTSRHEPLAMRFRVLDPDRAVVAIHRRALPLPPPHSEIGSHPVRFEC